MDLLNDLDQNQVTQAEPEAPSSDTAILLGQLAQIANNIQLIGQRIMNLEHMSQIYQATFEAMLQTDSDLRTRLEKYFVELAEQEAQEKAAQQAKEDSTPQV